MLVLQRQGRGLCLLGFVAVVFPECRICGSSRNTAPRGTGAAPWLGTAVPPSQPHCCSRAHGVLGAQWGLDVPQCHCELLGVCRLCPWVMPCPVLCTDFCCCFVARLLLSWVSVPPPPNFFWLLTLLAVFLFLFSFFSSFHSFFFFSFLFLLFFFFIIFFGGAEHVSVILILFILSLVMFYYQVHGRL